MKRVIIAAGLACGLFYCNNTQVSPTAPTGDTVQNLPALPTPNPAPTADQNPVDEPAPRQAKGTLRIDEDNLYAKCEQTTNYSRDYLSVWRVRDSGAQDRLDLYKSAEGRVPCGFKIQVDCTVRDPNPQAGNISTYDLYDAFIGTLTCPPPTPPKCDLPALERRAIAYCAEREQTARVFPEQCDFDCVDIPCEGTWVEVDREVGYRGECEQREKVTTISEKHDCIGETRRRVETERAPEECPEVCEEKPFHDNGQTNVTRSSITASYDAHNEGNWSLTLYAGFLNNPRKWTKSRDTASLECGENETLRVSYNHAGHSGCLWTLVASGPGLSRSTVVLNRCNVDNNSN